MRYKLKSLHVIILFAVLGSAIYSNVVLHGIFIFDDMEYVSGNTLIQDFTNIDLSDPRQIGYLSFALNYAIGGEDPRGYHLVNVVIHVINAVLVFFFIKTLLRALSGRAGMREDVRIAASFLTALIFLVHPLETMAVSYIAQRFTSLATFFYLAAVLAYLTARLRFEAEPHSRHAYFLYGCSILAALLAVRTKEITFTIPVMLTAIEFLLFTDSVFNRRRFIYVLPFAVIVLIIPLSIFGPDWGLLPPGQGIAEVTRQEKIYDFLERSPFSYLLTQFRVIVTYMRLLLFPVKQTVVYDYKISTSLFDMRVLSAVCLIILVMVLAYRSWVRSTRLAPDDAASSKLVAFGILWFFITLSVESSVIPIKDVIFEHRTYLPSVGFLAACSSLIIMGLLRLRVRVPFQISAGVAALLIALPLSAATWVRNDVWTNELTFWDDVVKKNPNKAIGYHNRGNAYGKLGIYDLALQDINKTISYFPKNPGTLLSYEIADFTPTNRAKTYMNRASIYLALGLKELADADNQKAKDLISSPPVDTDQALKLADTFVKKGAYLHAIEQYTKVLQWDPVNLDALNNRANAYSWTSNYQQAIGDLTRVLVLYPGYDRAYHNRGVAYAWSGQQAKAVADFEKACQMGFQPACESVGPAKQGLK